MILKAISAYYYSPNRDVEKHPTMACLMDSRNRSFQTAFDIAATELKASDSDSEGSGTNGKSPSGRRSPVNGSTSNADEKQAHF